MSKTLAALFGELASATEQQAAALRKLEGAYANASTKSEDSSGDGVAQAPAGSKDKKGAAAGAVAGKSAKPAKAKAPAVTFDDVKTKLTELMEKNGKQAVKELLSEYGAAKLADLEEDNYAEVVEKATEALAGGDEPEADEDDDMFGG